jgi:group I intron endonuclease
MPHCVTGIYRISNRENGKCYIGQSVSIIKRWAHHRGALNAGSHPNYRLQNSWNKHGEGQFVFEILEECPREDLNSIEQKWIEETKSYDPQFGYNILREVTSGYMSTDAWSNRMWIHREGELKFVRVEDFGFGNYPGFIPGRPCSRNNSPRGFHWFNNGEEERMLHPDDPRAQGLVKGKLKKNAKGRSWFNNGEEEKLFSKDHVPEGWVGGRLGGQELSQRSLGRVWCNNGLEERQVTPEEFKTLSGFSRGRILSMKGRKARSVIFNNGLVELRFEEGQEIPNGFSKGRLGENIEKLNKNRSLRSWFTDGKINIQIEKGSEPPEGFRPGRTRYWKT